MTGSQFNPIAGPVTETAIFSYSLRKNYKVNLAESFISLDFKWEKINASIWYAIWHHVLKSLKNKKATTKKIQTVGVSNSAFGNLS